MMDARRALRILLVTLIALPPIYLFIMIQHGAITFPFWDHVALINVISKYHDGRWRSSSFFFLYFVCAPADLSLHHDPARSHHVPILGPRGADQCHLEVP